MHLSLTLPAAWWRALHAALAWLLWTNLVVKRDACFCLLLRLLHQQPPPAMLGRQTLCCARQASLCTHVQRLDGAGDSLGRHAGILG